MFKELLPYCLAAAFPYRNILVSALLLLLQPFQEAYAQSPTPKSATIDFFTVGDTACFISGRKITPGYIGQNNRFISFRAKISEIKLSIESSSASRISKLRKKLGMFNGRQRKGLRACKAAYIIGEFNRPMPTPVSFPSPTPTISQFPVNLTELRQSLERFRDVHAATLEVIRSESSKALTLKEELSEKQLQAVLENSFYSQEEKDRLYMYDSYFKVIKKYLAHNSTLPLNFDNEQSSVRANGEWSSQLKEFVEREGLVLLPDPLVIPQVLETLSLEELEELQSSVLTVFGTQPEAEFADFIENYDEFLPKVLQSLRRAKAELRFALYNTSTTRPLPLLSSRSPKDQTEGHIPVQVITAWGFFRYDKNCSCFPDLKNPEKSIVQSGARSYYDPNQFIVLDIESLFELNSSEAQIEKDVEKLIQVIRWIHEVNENFLVGYYGIYPQDNYHGPASDIDSERYKYWLHQTGLRKKILNHVQFLAPSLYVPYADRNYRTGELWPKNIDWGRDGWIRATTAQVKKAKESNLPVVPFIWGFYNNVGPWKHEPLNPEYFQIVLATLATLRDQHIVSAAIIWGDNHPLSISPFPWIWRRELRLFLGSNKWSSANMRERFAGIILQPEEVQNRQFLDFNNDGKSNYLDAAYLRALPSKSNAEFKIAFKKLVKFLGANVNMTKDTAGFQAALDLDLDGLISPLDFWWCWISLSEGREEIADHARVFENLTAALLARPQDEKNKDFPSAYALDLDLNGDLRVNLQDAQLIYYFYDQNSLIRNSLLNKFKSIIQNRLGKEDKFIEEFDLNYNGILDQTDLNKVTSALSFMIEIDP